MSYITFEPAGRSKTGLTKIWLVMNTLVNIEIGRIQWYSNWRKYTYISPMHLQVILDAKCLREIADFTENETWNHKHAVRQR